MYISDETVKQWLSEELALATDNMLSISKISKTMSGNVTNDWYVLYVCMFHADPLPSWKCEYFQALHSYYTLRLKFNICLHAQYSYRIVVVLCREKLNQDLNDQEKLSIYHEIIQ